MPDNKTNSSRIALNKAAEEKATYLRNRRDLSVGLKKVLDDHCVLKSLWKAGVLLELVDNKLVTQPYIRARLPVDSRDTKGWVGMARTGASQENLTIHLAETPGQLDLGYERIDLKDPLERISIFSLMAGRKIDTIRFDEDRSNRLVVEGEKTTNLSPAEAVEFISRQALRTIQSGRISYYQDFAIKSLKHCEDNLIGRLNCALRVR